MNKPDQNNQAECCKDAGQDDKNQKQYSYIGIITDEKVSVSQSFVILANVSDLHIYLYMVIGSHNHKYLVFTNNDGQNQISCQISCFCIKTELKEVQPTDGYLFLVKVRMEKEVHTDCCRSSSLLFIKLCLIRPWQHSDIIITLIFNQHFMVSKLFKF